ncbi:substrate-binding periplasmic protein [Aeromonas diversa]|uniref:Amino acid ABC transporter substrate-binding protein n=1 Tax=Aeromonas diversa CDC 2478-85 TaxID=1268237 RepID=N9VEN7_9GAMM|nr:ABC transporter substrate-binding protein [Aeromonas diversa]ENY73687.1 amino acid ABC transporter substrate-binding protein [Aeromonas diversa CDC 2478-85]
MKAWWLVLLAITCVEAKTRVEIFTDSSYAPYSWQEGQEARGIYPDIVREVAKGMPDFELVLKPVPWRRALSMVEQGTAFALLPPYYNQDDRPWIWPYSQPLLDEEVVVVCNDKLAINTDEARFPQDYHGLRFGMNAGFSIGGKAFWDAVAAGKIELEPAKSNRENLLKILRGRVDCTINDKLSLLAEMLTMIKEGHIALEDMSRFRQGPVVTREQGFLGYAANDKGFPFKDQFVKQFDRALHQLRQQNGIARIVEHHVGKSQR